MNILGQQINFDFEIEKNAYVGFWSCGAWFNGEYYIIDATMRESLGYNGIVRNVELFCISDFVADYQFFQNSLTRVSKS